MEQKIGGMFADFLFFPPDSDTTTFATVPFLCGYSRGDGSCEKDFCRRYRCREVLGIARKIFVRSLFSIRRENGHQAHESTRVGSYYRNR